MLTESEIRQAVGQDAYDEGGDKIGQIGQIYLDNQTGQPEFITVKTSMFGSGENFVPVTEATNTDGHLTVPFSKDEVKSAPKVGPDQERLSVAEEEDLYRHYRMHYGRGGEETAGYAPGTTGVTGEATGETAGYTTGDTADDSMTRSEERLDVGTRRDETGRARLRKYVETEEVTTSVPVTRERAVVETESVSDTSETSEISDDEQEVVLHEETPVVGKHSEPVERVRLSKVEEHDQEEVTDEVRKEHIVAEGDVDDPRRHDR